MSLSEKFLIIFFLFALNVPLIYSQDSLKEKKEVKHIDSIYFESSVLFKCQIRLPNDYDPEESYTLVIGLHGYGSSAVFTYGAGIYNHQLFKGFICFGSWFESEWFPENLIKKANSLRVCIAHGKNDKRVKYEKAVKARNILIKNGYEVTFIDFVGGHTVDKRTLKLVQKWIKNE